jgi:S1-C subfamily serine protease
MRADVTIISLLIGLSTIAAIAKETPIKPSSITAKMAEKGRPLIQNSDAARSVSTDSLPREWNEIPLARVSKIAQRRFKEIGSQTRSAKDAQIYRTISPSVVLIATKAGIGSGSLIGPTGEVVTNFHVVRGYSTVAVIFKPAIEGKEPTRDDVRLGQVVKTDEVADLALVKVSNMPTGRSPIRLGDSNEISIGSDVHAIGHPTGEAWTYTTGVISQYRLGYEWQSEGDTSKHKADIIQTQTPINPGNSGGPLISDGGTLIGVNSFKASGEALNFAVSVDDVKKFLARPANRIVQNRDTAKKANCEPRELSKFRNKENNATIISFDMFCNGKSTGEDVIPDDESKAIYLRMDRNGDGNADVIFFDFKRRGKWDMSWWDEDFKGQWTLVGYHDDGSATPSRFESFAAYQRRVASR